MTADDVVRLYIQWIDFYHEAHFAVIKSIHGSPGCTRGDMWDDIHGAEVREDSAEADLFRLLVRDLSTLGVIRHRETTGSGEFVRPGPQPKGSGTRLMKSAFDDREQYELTELGRQFVHYTMNELVPRMADGREYWRAVLLAVSPARALDANSWCDAARSGGRVTQD